MLLDPSILSNENFIVTKHTIAKEECTFVRPKNIMVDWTEDTLHYRSSIWNSKGELISASYPKFFNFEEKPAIKPFSGDLNGCSVVEKIDGSCLILSVYNGEYIIRTRGTVDARQMPNGHEIDIFKERLALDKLNPGDTLNQTYLFEWVTPNNIIVLNYGPDPDFYLTGIINHNDYSLVSQEQVDTVASVLNVKRPPRYTFNDLKELLETVEKFEGKEGVVLYYPVSANIDQGMRKIKGSQYLKLHAFKSSCNYKTLLDLYFQWNKPSVDIFLSNIERTFDYECVTHAKPLVDKLYEKIHIINLKLISIYSFVEQNKVLEQKEFALKVKELFSNHYEHSICFAHRRGNDFSKSLRGMIEQELDNVGTVI